MNKVQAVYFDMGGVLMDIIPEYSREEAVRKSLSSQLVREYLGSSFDFQEYFTLITEDIDLRYKNPDNFEQDDAWAITKSNLELFLKKPVPFEVIHRVFWDFITYMTGCFTVRSEARPCLEYIQKRGYIIGLISNVFHPSIVYKQMFTRWEILDFFNPLIFSSNLIFKKPDPRIFEYAISCHPGLKAEDCLFVGDTYKIDVRGAITSKMVPVWMNNHGEDDNPLNVTEITSLSDLREIL